MCYIHICFLCSASCNGCQLAFWCNSKLSGFSRDYLSPYGSAYLIRWVGVGTSMPYQLSIAIFWDLRNKSCLSMMTPVLRNNMPLEVHTDSILLTFCKLLHIQKPLEISAYLYIVSVFGLQWWLNPFCLLYFVFCIWSLVFLGLVLVSCLLFWHCFIYFLLVQFLCNCVASKLL